MNKDSRKLLYDVHGWAGFVVGIALLIVCISGSVAVFSPEIDRWLNPILQAAPETPVTIDADQALATLVARSPSSAKSVEGDKRTLELPNASLPGRYGMMVAVKGGFDYVYLAADSGAVLPPRSNHIYYFLRHLHVRLLYNRIPVGIVGVAMLLSIASGLLIYKHILRDMFRMRWRRTGNLRVTIADFHKLVGFWALLFHLVIASTGTWLALEGYLNPVITKIAGRSASLINDGEPDEIPPADAPPPGQARYPLAAMIARSRSQIADFEPTHVTVDDAAAHPTARISGNVPGLVQQGSSHVVFDRVTGRVEKTFDVRAQPFWTQFRYALEAVHYGYYGGFWVKLLYLVIGLMPAVLSITGALLWFERRRRDARGPRPERQGAPA